MSQAIEEWLLTLNVLKRKNTKNKIDGVLRDPLLWLRLNHSDEKVNEVLQHLRDLGKPGAPEDYHDKRGRVCDKLINDIDSDRKRQAENLKSFFCGDKKAAEIREKLFPRFPVELVPVEVQAHQGIPLESETYATLRGIVTDLYSLPVPWEGYITSTPSEPKEKSVVYRFTNESCTCAFPLCLGSIVEFCPNKSPAFTVVNGSLTVIQYFPGTLSREYAVRYLQQLENLGVSDRLNKIREFPGPFTTMLNEKELYTSHWSRILAMLNSISDDDSGRFQYIIHELLCLPSSELTNVLPSLLCKLQPQEEPCRDVLYFLRLVAICVGSNPDYAFTMTSVVQGCCARLAELFPREFAIEGRNLSGAVVHACSTVRSQEIPLQTAEATTEQSITPEKAMLDPLMWVAFYFGTSEAESLRSHILQRPLCDEDENVAARRKSENILQSVVEGKLDPKPENPSVKGVHAVKQMSLTPSKDSQLKTLPGIVTDLYPDGVGYVALTLRPTHSGRRDQRHCIFKLDSQTTTTTVTPRSIHIGDLVNFQVGEGAPNTVQCVVKVRQYCAPGLDRTFVDEYLSHVETGELFHNEPAMKGMLNAPQVYVIPEICTKLISSATESLYDSSVSTRRKMLELLKYSSFVCKIIEIAPQEVSRSAHVLKHYLEQFPNEVSTLAPTLQDMTEHLLDQNKPLDLAKFVSFLSTSVCFLPRSIEIARQPWQSIPTILTKEECKAGTVANKEYLPKVIDRYSSVNEYGRTYFLLLRADCLGSLALAMSRLRDPGSSTRKDSETIVVCDATFHDLSIRSSGHQLVYHFTMETRPLPRETTSRESPLFKTGNLLCLSVGGRFEDDIIWATINHIDGYVHTEDREDGVVKSCEVYLQLCTESNSLSDEDAVQRLKASRNTVALESPAYFRAYQPVLDVLKRMDLGQIHFIQDLINPGPVIKSSLSLIDSQMLVTDLAGLYSDGAGEIPKAVKVWELEMKLREEDTTEFCLHKYQRLAVARALTQPLSLIQGPPGTGKSYIGMQLLRLFLLMKNGSGELVLDNKPALVMAYKNRALDLFILMCESFCPLHHIVRLGHVSEDNEEKLKPCLLKERVTSALPRGPTVALRDRMQSQYERVKRARSELEALTKLQGMEDFVEGLTPEWLKSLIIDGKDDVDKTIVHLIGNEPDRCLKLLQMKQMGREDREKKQALEAPLKKAWTKWVTGASQWKKSFATKKSRLNTYDSDSEYDPVEAVMDYAYLGGEDAEFEPRKPKAEIFSPSFYDDLEKGDPVEVTNVWEMSGDERRRLIVSALRDRYERAMEDLTESMKQYNIIREEYEKRYNIKAVEILKKAKIVAMTTTGAAINQRLLSELAAPLVIVEEAAEILESNLLAVLTPHVKHAVLIGDHKQLKPNLAWPRLEKHKFNLSMFERLVKNKYPHTLLLRQHRMHPSLVPLFQYHYKNDIRSTEKTHELKHPECMASNFFWWSYAGPHIESRRETSVFNEHEVEMVVSLCCWLVSNRVESKNIAILTPYRGQLEEIKKSLKNKANAKRLIMPVALTEIDVYTVDEYQGHEKDVVILSLVLNNSSGRIGFLSRHNRLVVGTTRQKRALYIVGNHTFLEKSSPILWKEFLSKCKAETIGTGLPIVVGNSITTCGSASDLESRAIKLLEVSANNTGSGATNETDSDPTSTSTPASVRSQQSAPSTPRSARSQSVDNSPFMGAQSPLADSTPFSHATTPPPYPQTVSHSHEQAPPAAHLPAQRQQSSPPVLTSSHQSTTHDSSSCTAIDETEAWGFVKCILRLKDTGAASKWKFIGRQLGVDETEITAIERNTTYSGSIKEMFYQMMLKWKETKGEKATREELIRALTKEGLKQIVEQLEKHQY